MKQGHPISIQVIVSVTGIGHHARDGHDNASGMALMDRMVWTWKPHSCFSSPFFCSCSALQELCDSDLWAEAPVRGANAGRFNELGLRAVWFV